MKPTGPRGQETFATLMILFLLFAAVVLAPALMSLIEQGIWK